MCVPYQCDDKGIFWKECFVCACTLCAQAQSFNVELKKKSTRTFYQILDQSTFIRLLFHQLMCSRLT